MRKTAPLFVAIFGFLAILAATGTANAQSIIKTPENHPNVELEPHGNLGVFHHAGRHGYGGKGGIGHAEPGVGFRATILVMDPGFVPKINDSAGITFGADIASCRYGCDDDFAIWTPVGVNWSFYFTRDWSAFAEGGLVFQSNSLYHDVYADYFAQLGGRYHFSDKAALTMRVGYPFISVGVSFYVGD